MTPRTPSVRSIQLVVALGVACAIAGCGFKGPLELPDRPSNIVIRPAPGTVTPGTAPQEGPTTGAPTASGSGAGVPGQTNPAGATPPPAEPERLPPPELPRGQRGGGSS